MTITPNSFNNWLTQAAREASGQPEDFSNTSMPAAAAWGIYLDDQLRAEGAALSKPEATPGT